MYRTIRLLVLTLLCASCLVGCRFYHPIKFRIDQKWKSNILYKTSQSNLKVSGEYMYAGGQVYIFLKFRFVTPEKTSLLFDETYIKISGVNVLGKKLSIDSSNDHLYRYYFTYLENDIPSETLSSRMIHVDLSLANTEKIYGLELLLPKLRFQADNR
jgi:hypothetical protein